MSVFKFPDCNCEFPIVGEGKILYVPKFEHVNPECPRTWALIQSGNVRGCFQIESQLGRSLCKKLKPEHIEHLSALVAIMRPGCLESIQDGKTITQHYIDRKNCMEQVTYYHPALEPILNKSYGCMIYQEQALFIATQIAGYTLVEADLLRKAIGKKIPELMAKNKEMFIEKAVAKGILTRAEAEEIFSWIEKSQRYSFNHSHSVCYAADAYVSAFTKAHFPRVFFTSWLYYARDKSAKKTEEVKELVNNAKSMGIGVNPPDIERGNARFRLIDKSIYFGMSDIKGIGEAVVEKILARIFEVEKEHGHLSDMSWPSFLVHIGQHVNSKGMEGLINAGALGHFEMDRNLLLFEYKHFSNLTEKEIKYVSENLSPRYNSVKDLIHLLLTSPVGRAGGISSQKRKLVVEGLYESLKNPPYSLKDRPEWVSGIEEATLGVALTANKVDGCSEAQNANCSCAEFADNKSEYILLAVEVKKCKETSIKNGDNEGKKMAFLTVEDKTGMLDNVVCFSECWAVYRGLAFEGNTVLIGGNKNKDSFLVKNIFQI